MVRWFLGHIHQPLVTISGSQSEKRERTDLRINNTLPTKHHAIIVIKVIINILHKAGRANRPVRDRRLRNILDILLNELGIAATITAAIIAITIVRDVVVDDHRRHRLGRRGRHVVDNSRRQVRLLVRVDVVDDGRRRLRRRGLDVVDDHRRGRRLRSGNLVVDDGRRVGRRRGRHVVDVDGNFLVLVATGATTAADIDAVEAHAVGEGVELVEAVPVAVGVDGEVVESVVAVPVAVGSGVETDADGWAGTADGRATEPAEATAHWGG